MLTLAKEKSLSLPPKSKKIALLKVIKKDDKKLRLEGSEIYLHKGMECYNQVIQDQKEISINPQIILVFNSRKRILEFSGFPMLMKEIAEIFESGNLLDYRCIDFVSSI